MPDEQILLDEKTRGKLNQLTLVASKIRAGALKGERRSSRRGTSIEFADYRNYAPGDDLRRLDWNIYARLERPYIKLLEDEEDLAVHLLLDTSASMHWPLLNNPESGGDPAHHKLTFAKKLFAGLAYISLNSNDRLLLTALSDRGLLHFGPTRGQAHSAGMLRFAHDLTPAGITDLSAMLRDFALRAGRPGLVFIISDMFSPNGYLPGLNELLGRGFEVALLHVMSPDEITPPLAGDLRLVDVETGLHQEVTLDSAMRSLYTQRVQAWIDSVRTECRKRGVHYLHLTSDGLPEKAILYDLRRLGVVK